MWNSDRAATRCGFIVSQIVPQQFRVWGIKEGQRDCLAGFIRTVPEQDNPVQVVTLWCEGPFKPAECSKGAGNIVLIHGLYNVEPDIAIQIQSVGRVDAPHRRQFNNF